MTNFGDGIIISTLNLLQVSDVGGSMAIHTYGAYFGLGASAGLQFKKSTDPPSPGAIRLDGPSYTSDVTAMIGSYANSLYKY